MRAFFYNVEPRYTPGSPAAVNQQLAERIAREERHSIERALKGAWGQTHRQRAETLGLGLIVYSMKETAKGWEVVDLITEKRYFWPFVATCPWCSRKKVRCTRGKLDEHGTCPGKVLFVGRELEPPSPR